MAAAVSHATPFCYDVGVSPSQCLRWLAALIGVTFALLGAGRVSADFPPNPTTYFDGHVKLDAAAKSRLLAGQAVTKMLDSDASKEVAVFGAVWIDAPIDRYLSAVRDIEQFEKGDAFR